jgi:hypothetical protein
MLTILLLAVSAAALAKPSPSASAPSPAATNLIPAAALTAPHFSELASIASDPVVRPEITSKVVVSNHDVNRIACPGSIGDVFFSQERPIEISTAGANVFAKFKIRQEAGKFVMTTEPVDVHVVCDEAVYTVVLVPKDIDSVTIRLQPANSKELKHIVKEWGEMPLEGRIERLTLLMYRNDFPEGIVRMPIVPEDFRRNVILTDKDGKAVPGVSITCEYQVEAHGTGLQGEECQVVTDHATEFNEGDFLTRQFGSVVGVTIDPIKVEAHQPARLFIIQRSVAHES